MDFSPKKNVTAKNCHIFQEDKNGYFILDFFWIRSVKIGSNLINLQSKKVNNELNLSKIDESTQNWIWLVLVGGEGECVVGAGVSEWRQGGRG